MTIVETTPEPSTASGDSTPIVATVVIPAHNAGETLGQQLEALARQQGAPTFETIVVANRCTDDTIDVARAFAERLHGFDVVVANEQASASFARNVGARCANGEFVLFCDADDEVHPGWVAGMVDALQVTDVVGGAVVPMAGSPAWVTDHFGPPPQRDDLPRWDGRVRFAIGANLGARREVFAETAGWDDELSHGSDDLAFCAIAQQAGFSIGAAPDAVVSYRTRSSFRETLRQQAHYGRGAGRFRVTHEPELLRPVPVQAARLGRYAVRVARPRPGQDRRSELVHLAQQVEKFRSEVATRRELGLNAPLSTAAMAKASVAARVKKVGDSSVGQRWLQARRAGVPSTDFTAPPSAALIGGKAFTAPLAIAREGAKRPIEPLLLDYIAESVRPGASIVDVGANVGWVATAFALAAGPSGTITAFEPTPDTAALLASNLTRHGVADQVSVHQVAVASEPGRATLHCYALSVVNSLAATEWAGSTGTIEVDVVRLDDVISEPVDILKIDVEGFESEVLQGAQQLIADNPGIDIVLELNPAALGAAGSSVAEMLALVPGVGAGAIVLEDEPTSPFAGQIRPLAEVLEWLDADPSAAARWYANLIIPSVGA